MSIPTVETTTYGEPVYAEANANSKLGQDAFFKLFLTQIQNQDPLNPMESAEFAAQLAQFSSLEQLININDALGVLDEQKVAMQGVEAATYIGKEVKALGNQLSLVEGEEAKGNYLLDTQGQVVINIYDSDGNLVRTLDLGEVSSGDKEFTWDGRTSTGAEAPSGVYTFEVLATNAAGDELSPLPYVEGVCTGVDYSRGIPILLLGDREVAMEYLLEVRQTSS